MDKEPKFKVIKSYGKIEVREYEPFLVAEIEVEDERQNAIRRGFFLLADFIFGDNQTKTKIAMKIPVTQQQIGHIWKVRFMMPSEYSEKTIPKPNNPQIKLYSIQRIRFVTIRFSGTPTDKKIDFYVDKLKQFCRNYEWKISDAPILAFYNRPSTLSFLRRNEVMFEICS